MDIPPDHFALVDDFIRDAIRSEPLIPFHRDSIYYPISGRVAKDIPQPALKSAFTAVIANIEKSCPAAAITLRVRDESVWGVDVDVRPGHEWSHILRYIHGSDDVARILSPAAEELLTRTEDGELTEFRKELSVRHRIRHFGFRANFKSLLEEIEAKRGIRIAMEEQGKSYPQKEHLLKFTITARDLLAKPIVGRNPTVPAGILKDGKRLEFKRWFLDYLASSSFDQPAESIWSISTRAEFLRCFPDPDGKVESSPILELLQVVREHPAIRIGYSFEPHKGTWFVTIGPAKSWKETRETLTAEMSRKGAAEEYQISAAAGVLLEWARTQTLEHGLTPVIETAIEEDQLLLECPWSEENQRLFLTLLCEEITDRSPLRLTPRDWHDEHEVVTRLHVGPKPSAL